MIRLEKSRIDCFELRTYDSRDNIFDELIWRDLYNVNRDRYLILQRYVITRYIVFKGPSVALCVNGDELEGER